VPLPGRNARSCRSGRPCRKPRIRHGLGNAPDWSVLHLILGSMSGPEMLVEQRDEEEAPGSTPRGSRRFSRWSIAGVLAISVLLGLVLAYSLWWSKPNTFPGVGNKFSMKQTVEGLHPITFDMVARSVDDDPETITLSGVRPRVVINTADALITFAVCQRGEPFMSAEGTAARSCEEITDVDGGQVRLTPAATTTITMTVTPRRAGRVVIRGMDVTYARGSDHLWQRGSQVTGPVVAMKVKD